LTITSIIAIIYNRNVVYININEVRDMTWNRFFTGLWNIIWAIFRFFGRMLRDMVLQIWRPVRRFLIKWSPLYLGVIAAMGLHKLNPKGTEDLLQSILTIGIVFIGIKIIILGFKK